MIGETFCNTEIDGDRARNIREMIARYVKMGGEMEDSALVMSRATSRNMNP